MLEKNNFLESKLDVISHSNEKRHFHPEIELIYILDGTVAAKLGSEEYYLERDDILLINTNTHHQLVSYQDALFIKVTLGFFQICKIIGEDYLLFWCNTKIDNNKCYTELRHILNNLVMSYVETEKSKSFTQYANFCKLISFLIENFKINSNSSLILNMKEDKKLSFIINYIQMHYMEKIRLSDIAPKLFTSVSALSRFFAKSTGISFVDYLKEVRIQKITERLIYSDDPITKIAVENGFSSPSIMNKVFSDNYGMTPSSYRKNFRTNHEITSIHSKLIDNSEKIKKLLMVESEPEEHDHIDTVSVNGKNMNTYKKWDNKIVNVGSASYLYISDIQKQISFLKNELDIKYIRIWNVFSDKFMIRTDAYGSDLNFDNIDRVFDFCVKNDIYLFIDLGARQETSMIGKNASLYVTNESIVFSSKFEWIEFVSKFLKHLQKRYGSSIVSQWIFELSFYLNHEPYYIDENYNYLDVWQSGYELIKSIIPGCKVAGPGFKVFSSSKMAENAIKQLFETKCIPDIFTMMIFPYVDHKEGDEVYTTRLVEPEFLYKEVSVVKDILARYDFNNEFWVTEWSDSISNRNYIQDSCHRGTSILKNTLMTYDMLDGLGFWYASDLINVYYDSKNILNGGSGILTKNGVCKPAFYALKFLSSLGGFLINKSENCIVTTNNGRNYRVVCFNNLNFGPFYFLQEEDSYTPTELGSLYEQNGDLNFHLDLNDLINGDNYLIHQQIVNEFDGSVLDKWIELGCESELTLEEVSYLKRTCVPKVTKSRRLVKNNTLSLDIEMRPHEMRFINIVLDD